MNNAAECLARAANCRKLANEHMGLTKTLPLEECDLHWLGAARMDRAAKRWEERANDGRE